TATTIKVKKRLSAICTHSLRSLSLLGNLILNTEKTRASLWNQENNSINFVSIYSHFSDCFKVINEA
ncbi:hypothetical protein, partial [Staphylococcus delphini]|uniref:hypothetical protein n=1 Tax=Staphylococcus delphini TaxID=53344 RepID=UPI001CA5B519